MTKRMEGEGPKITMVLYKYVRFLNNLSKKKTASKCPVLEPMYNPMIQVTQKYIDLTLKCDTVLLATFLHPAWRMMLFNLRFVSHVHHITSLVQRTFTNQETEIQAAQPDSPTEIQIQLESNEDGNSPKSDPELDAYNFFPIAPEAKQINTELQRYKDGAFPMDRKGCVLGFWKVSFIT